MKYLGIDYGTKHIGLATSDEGGSLAFPLTTIAAGREALSAVADIVKKEKIEKIIMGESRNFAGEPNAVMEEASQFKKDLEDLTMLPVEYEQEFFSSSQAARQFAPDGSRKQNPSQEKLDASAAAVILQSFLDRMKNHGTNFNRRL